MEESISKATKEGMGRRYRDSFLKLEETIRRTRLSNDRLSQRMFTLNNRAANVAEKIGFPTFDELEEAVLNEPHLWNVDAIKANHIQVASMKGQSRLQDGDRCELSDSFRGEFERLKRQVLLLEQRSNMEEPGTHMIDPSESCAPKRFPLTPLKSVGNSSPLEGQDLRAEIRILSRKYDALVTAKERAEKKYKEDYRKWKSFKSWLFNKSKHAEVLRALLAEEKLDFGIKFQGIAGDNDDKTRLASSPRPSSLPRSTRGENDSPHPSPALLLATPEGANTSMRRSELGRIENHHAKTYAIWSESPSQETGKRKEPLSEPKVALEMEFVEGASRIEGETSTSHSARLKSRYTEATNAEEALNALYEIDASRNNGLPFQFDEIVRGRELRQRLEAGDCDCCREYYNCVAPLPSRPGPPAWDSLSPTDDDNTSHRHRGQPLLEAMTHHKKQISRHRHQWSPAKTPPDYWNIGFPTTQEAADINRRAADLHAEKRRRVEEEARTNSGRYVRREI